MRIRTTKRPLGARGLILVALAAVAGVMIAVPAASARSGAHVRLSLPPSSLASAGSLRLPSDSTQYTLTVTVTDHQVVGIGIGPAGGTVTSSPAGIDCRNTCSAAFTAGTQVTLTETPDPGSAFGGWSGCAPKRLRFNQCVVTLNGDTTVTASFVSAPPIPLLTVALAGTGSGTVTSSPAGIDCPATACKVNASPGTQISLTETPDPGSSFSGWSGGACSGTTTCVVTLNSESSVNITVGADFEVPYNYSPPPNACVVPNVKGKTLAAAKKTIRSHHCGVGKITKAKSSLKNKGHVISQNPKPGWNLKNGAKVALKVGR